MSLVDLGIPITDSFSATQSPPFNASYGKWSNLGQLQWKGALSCSVAVVFECLGDVPPPVCSHEAPRRPIRSCRNVGYGITLGVLNCKNFLTAYLCKSFQLSGVWGASASPPRVTVGTLLWQLVFITDAVAPLAEF